MRHARTTEQVDIASCSTLERQNNFFLIFGSRSSVVPISMIWDPIWVHPEGSKWAPRSSGSAIWENPPASGEGDNPLLPPLPRTPSLPFPTTPLWGLKAVRVAKAYNPPPLVPSPGEPQNPANPFESVRYPLVSVRICSNPFESVGIRSLSVRIRSDRKT